MLVAAIVFITIICTVALAFNALNLAATRAGLMHSPTTFTHLLGSAATLAIAGFALSMSVPDQPDDPLANHLPPSWLNAAATTAHDVADPFSPEAVRQAQADQAAIAAVKAGTAVDRFIHVHEGDAHDMLAVLEHHIARGGGHTAPAPEDVIIATVPASYQPCLEAITAPELDRQLTPNYREFALAAVSGSHRCPPQPASPQRAVRIFFTVEPIGILNNYWDQIIGTTMLTVAALGLTGLAIGSSCQTWFQSRPETSLN